MEFIRTINAGGQPKEDIPLGAIGLRAGARVATVSATALTLHNDHHGLILDFTAASAVTLTVPEGLRPDFVVGISQGGDGKVTLSPDGAVDINEADGNLATERQYVLTTLVAFGQDDYRFYGRTAA